MILLKKLLVITEQAVFVLALLSLMTVNIVHHFVAMVNEIKLVIFLPNNPSELEK